MTGIEESQPLGAQRRALGAQKLKWAASQEAVTFPWLSAHSIRKRIGGDSYIVDPSDALSRDNFRDFKLELTPAQKAVESLTLLPPGCYFDGF